MCNHQNGISKEIGNEPNRFLTLYFYCSLCHCDQLSSRSGIRQHWNSLHCSVYLQSHLAAVESLAQACLQLHWHEAQPLQDSGRKSATASVKTVCLQVTLRGSHLRHFQWGFTGSQGQSTIRRNKVANKHTIIPAEECFFTLFQNTHINNVNNCT